MDDEDDGRSSLRNDDRFDLDFRDGATSDEAQVSGEECPLSLTGGEETAPKGSHVAGSRKPKRAGPAESNAVDDNLEGIVQSARTCLCS